MADIGETASIDMGRFSKALSNAQLPADRGTSVKMSDTNFQRDDPPDRGVAVSIDVDDFSQRNILMGFQPTLAEYFMRGKDVDCGPLTYRYWVSYGQADLSGARYDGTRCGVSPLEDIVILSID